MLMACAVAVRKSVLVQCIYAFCPMFEVCPDFVLIEASEARKARLLALKKRRASEAVGEESTESPEPILATRSFDLETRTLRKRTVEDVEMDDTVEREVEGLAERIVAKDEERRAQELDLLNIAPKRPNWDLKREMEKKLSKLKLSKRSIRLSVKGLRLKKANPMTF